MIKSNFQVVWTPAQFLALYKSEWFQFPSIQTTGKHVNRKDEQFNLLNTTRIHCRFLSCKSQILFVTSLCNKTATVAKCQRSYDIFLCFYFFLVFFSFSFYCVPCVRFHNKYKAATEWDFWGSQAPHFLGLSRFIDFRWQVGNEYDGV